jgi:hypothetical protein
VPCYDLIKPLTIEFLTKYLADGSKLPTLTEEDKKFEFKNGQIIPVKQGGKRGRR